MINLLFFKFSFLASFWGGGQGSLKINLKKEWSRSSQFIHVFIKYTLKTSFIVICTFLLYCYCLEFVWKKFWGSRIYLGGQWTFLDPLWLNHCLEIKNNKNHHIEYNISYIYSAQRCGFIVSIAFIPGCSSKIYRLKFQINENVLLK